MVFSASLQFSLSAPLPPTCTCHVSASVSPSLRNKTLHWDLWFLP